VRPSGTSDLYINCLTGLGAISASKVNPLSLDAVGTLLITSRESKQSKQTNNQRFDCLVNCAQIFHRV